MLSKDEKRNALGAIPMIKSNILLAGLRKKQYLCAVFCTLRLTANKNNPISKRYKQPVPNDSQPIEMVKKHTNRRRSVSDP